MPKIIFTSRYIKNPKKANAGNLIKYMGTSEGVEKLPNGTDNSHSTKKQHDLICTALKAVPEAWDYPKMKAYLAENTKSNASEFLNEFMQRNADRINGVKKLVNYYGNRPGVEKLGTHGLFSQSNDKINIDSIADEVANHDGFLWTHVISLKREDAERLGYNTAEKWRELVRRNVNEIAQAHKIDISNLKWYAAFHNTTHHPHIHLMVYSNDAKQGYLTNNGIEKMRSVFANDIFRNEMYHIFKLQSNLRDEVKQKAVDRIAELVKQTSSNLVCPLKLDNLFKKLITQLPDCKGKKLYGYLPKEVKETVDRIVSEIAKDKNVAEVYALWNNLNKEKLSTYYDKPKPDIPLEENKEFRSIKNVIVRSASLLRMIQAQSPDTPVDTNGIVLKLITMLINQISESYNKKMNRLNSQIDSKLRLKINKKKQAQGIKVQPSQQSDNNDDNENQNAEMIM